MINKSAVTCYSTPDFDEFFVRYCDDPGAVGIVMISVWIQH